MAWGLEHQELGSIKETQISRYCSAPPFCVAAHSARASCAVRRFLPELEAVCGRAGVGMSPSAVGCLGGASGRSSALLLQKKLSWLSPHSMLV